MIEVGVYGKDGAGISRADVAIQLPLRINNDDSTPNSLICYGITSDELAGAIAELEVLKQMLDDNTATKVTGGCKINGLKVSVS